MPTMEADPYCQLLLRLMVALPKANNPKFTRPREHPLKRFKNGRSKWAVESHREGFSADLEDGGASGHLPAGLKLWGYCYIAGRGHLEDQVGQEGVCSVIDYQGFYISPLHLNMISFIDVLVPALESLDLVNAAEALGRRLAVDRVEGGLGLLTLLGYLPEFVEVRFIAVHEEPVEDGAIVEFLEGV